VLYAERGISLPQLLLPRFKIRSSQLPKFNLIFSDHLPSNFVENQLIREINFRIYFNVIISVIFSIKLS
jgi:hypothetical protein